MKSLACVAKARQSMVLTQLDDPLVRAVLTLLRIAHDQGQSLNRTKVAKLLYLADLRAVGQGGIAFTGATWSWDNYGPFDLTLYRVEHTLSAAGLVEVDAAENSGEVRLRLVKEVEVPLGTEDSENVWATVAEHGGKTAATLRDLTYQTGAPSEVRGCSAHVPALSCPGVAARSAAVRLLTVGGGSG